MPYLATLGSGYHLHTNKVEVSKSTAGYSYLRPFPPSRQIISCARANARPLGLYTRDSCDSESFISHCFLHQTLAVRPLGLQPLRFTTSYLLRLPLLLAPFIPTTEQYRWLRVRWRWKR